MYGDDSIVVAFDARRSSISSYTNLADHLRMLGVYDSPISKCMSRTPPLVPVKEEHEIWVRKQPRLMFREMSRMSGKYFHTRGKASRSYPRDYKTI